MPGCEHEWRRRSESRESYLGFMRRCVLCGRVEVWRQRVRVSPENAPDLGAWVESPDWLEEEMRRLGGGA